MVRHYKTDDKILCNTKAKKIVFTEIKVDVTCKKCLKKLSPTPKKVKEKKPFQDIFTPDCITEELLKFIPIKQGDKILEPTAGTGNMAEVLLKQVSAQGISINLTCNEIQKKHSDVLKKRLSKYGKIV